MELNEYSQQRNKAYIMRVLNKKYWPHHVMVSGNAGEVERWCYERFKSSDWRNVGTYFAFKRSEDAMMLTLRWS